MTEQFILELIEKFNTSNAVALNLSIGDSFLELKKADAYKQKMMYTSTPIMSPVANDIARAEPLTSIVDTSKPQKTADVACTTDEELEFISSPLVGTFYRSPSPDAPSYAEEGKIVKKGQPLCILEAMKMMNNLESEYDCLIERVLVCNGDMIEYGQKLFQVKRV